MNHLTKIAAVSTFLVAGAAAQAATLYSNGPVVPANGVSVIDPATTTYGLAAGTTAGYRVADDFTVGAGQSWSVQSINFYSYQTGATAFPLVSATWSVISGDVNTGTVVASGTTTLTNDGMVGYRVSATTLTDTTRRIWSANANMPDFTLTSGSYWLTWTLTGSASFSGPWAPPTSDGVQGNAQQAATGASFASAVDATTGATFELPFMLNGVINAVPEPTEVALMLAGLGALALVRRRG